MREIKFRGWDENGSTMYYSKDNDGKISTFFQMFENENLPFMQYTGLHDSTKWEQLTTTEQKRWLDLGKSKEQWNGKEIYEGDIIRKGNDDIDIVMFGNIGYDGDRNGLTGFGLKSDYEEKENFFELQYYDEPDGYEVIGNIYENPELLKDTQ